MIKKTFRLKNHLIKEGGRVFVIAEAGVNHNGRLDLALRLVDMAAEIGADAVKFQTFRAEELATEKAEMAEYQKKNLGKSESQRAMLKKLELPEEFYRPIIKRCKEKGIIFFSTPHGGKKSVDLLESLGVELYKIDSGNLTNYVLFDKLARLKKPIILSTGMATLKEVVDAVKFIKSYGNNKIVVLHCTTNYPCKPDEVDLNAMVTLMKKLDVPVGYSDHSEGNQVATMASALGMAVYEFHITLDKKMPGPDQVASADPIEAKSRIDAIRKSALIMGNPIKRPRKSEKQYIKMVRRSLVYSRDFKKGKKITFEDIEGKRPGNGIPTLYFKNYVGKVLKKSVKLDQQISNSDFK